MRSLKNNEKVYLCKCGCQHFVDSAQIKCVDCGMTHWTGLALGKSKKTRCSCGHDSSEFMIIKKEDGPHDAFMACVACDLFFRWLPKPKAQKRVSKDVVDLWAWENE